MPLSWHRLRSRKAVRVYHCVGEQCSPLRDNLCRPDTSGAPRPAHHIKRVGIREIVGEHIVLPCNDKSNGSWANNVRPYGMICANRIQAVRRVGAPYDITGF